MSRMTHFQQLAAFSNRKLLAILFSILAIFAPALAFAGETDVKLEFKGSDQIYLIISAAIGLLAIIVAFAIRSQLLKLDTGGEKMEEVGSAIHTGAIAYLKQQMTMMIPFVIVIAGLLWFMYKDSYGQILALWVGVSFIGGVSASYLAGYIGMDMAVRANMRTAAAALTSYAKSLETAFRAGAVAGLLTVGMGLIGATIIFFAGKGDAMKLLIGFGFGGSLAALFMRVGGGIFTKAADVGADLVGKVEAGIPEDDPRNPAVIADNVGDNVGDCAGMAADIFESYEVTLVAAIVLGAACSSIFDQTTWMKLVLFALMARGVGILASIVGIFAVKGSDDINADPLKAIKKGFNLSAFIAILATLGTAYFMMGGDGKFNIQSVRIQSTSEAQAMVFDKVKAEQKSFAEVKYKGDITKVTLDDLKEVKAIKDLNLDEGDAASPTLKRFLEAELEDRPKETEMAGFSKLTEASTNPAMDYTVQKAPDDPTQQGKPTYISIRDWLKENKDAKVFNLEVDQGQPAGGPTKPKTQKVWAGPITKEALDKFLANIKKSQPALKVKVHEENAVNVALLVNKEGKLVIGAEGHDMTKQIVPLSFSPQYYKLNPAATQKAVEDAAAGAAAGKTAPRTFPMEFAGTTYPKAAWWQFALCIIFGILMALAFERLTDYYVSLHGKPVQEVAHVATAGPAPMIIQGFSHAAESSVFSVLAIVVSLLVPLVVFNPTTYGTYLLSFYGIALVGLGLLTTTGFILAMDTFGPISDNAQGVFEMSGAGHDNKEASRAVQLLDAAGNTTKALTKGFAIATAVVAAVALFHSYVEEAHLAEIGMRLEYPRIFLGLLIGGAAPFLFTAFSINAVGRAAFRLINEVRQQFRNDAGIMAGTSKPDYGRCVAIVTAAAQQELLGPGILAIFLPVAVAFGFSLGEATKGGYNLAGAQALGGFLAGSILSGQLLAVLLANSGGIWDNAKKLIEDGMHGGKGTEAHKAGVVCDTVGDPFKDTAGPALNPLIKVMNLVALLLAPIIIKPLPPAIAGTITGIAVLALIISIIFSKRGSMSSGMKEAEES